MTMAAFAGSASDFKISSQNLLNSPRGRLSTQKKPRSSSARRKVPFPEPLRPVRMMKEDLCMRREKRGLKPATPCLPDMFDRVCSRAALARVSVRLRFGLDPTDIPILSFVNHVEPLRVGVPEHQKFAFGTLDLNGGVIDTHGLGCYLVRPNDARQSLSEGLLDFNNRCGRDHFTLMVVVVTLPRYLAFLVSQDLFFHLINDGRDRCVHVRRNFLAMIKITACLDIQLRDVTLVFFDSEDEMRFKDFIHDST